MIGKPEFNYLDIRVNIFDITYICMGRAHKAMKQAPSLTLMLTYEKRALNLSTPGGDTRELQLEQAVEEHGAQSAPPPVAAPHCGIRCRPFRPHS